MNPPGKQLNTPRGQRGVALITAILFVAIVTILATKLTWDNQINIRRTEATLMQEQARAIALATEAVAIGSLEEFDPDPDFDIKNDGWISTPDNLVAQTTPVGIDDVDFGTVTVSFEDAQGKLNINNLAPLPLSNPNNPGQQPQPDPIAKEMFEQLFFDLGLDRRLVDNLIDWIDPDTVPSGQGVEDDAYTSKAPGYRAANDYMTSISELRAIEGFNELEPGEFAELNKHITAIRPDWCGSGGITPVNVNFATAEVLAAIPQGGASSEAQGWFDDMLDNGWKQPSDLPQPLTDRSDYVGLKSDCLKLNVTVTIGDSRFTMYSLLDRSSGNTEIVARVRAYGLD